MIEHILLKQNLLDVVHPNAAELNKTDQVAFAMARRSGLGASDASVYLGVNLYTSLDELIAEKKTIGYTDREVEISNNPNVRKGRDLEPLILQKFSEQMNIEVQKPAPMYRLIEHPQLIINFDGVILMGEQPIPVEAKWVSTYGDKYWDKSKSISTLFEGKEYICGGSDIIDHIKQEADLYGIPAYYYTQLQQQLLGLRAPFGYFSVIFDKNWEHKVFKVFRDKFTQDVLISESYKVWQRIRPSE